MWRSISRFTGGVAGLIGGTVVAMMVAFFITSAEWISPAAIKHDLAIATVVVGAVVGTILGYRVAKKDVGRRPSECQRCGHSILDIQGDRCLKCGHPLADFQRETPAKPLELEETPEPSEASDTPDSADPDAATESDDRVQSR